MRYSAGLAFSGFKFPMESRGNFVSDFRKVGGFIGVEGDGGGGGFQARGEVCLAGLFVTRMACFSSDQNLHFLYTIVRWELIDREGVFFFACFFW